MLNEFDWENAFGKADEAFEQNVHFTLNQIKNGQEVPRRKKSATRRIIFVIAAVFLLTGSVFAAYHTSQIVAFFAATFPAEFAVPEAASVLAQIPENVQPTDELSGSFAYTDGYLRDSLEKLEKLPESHETEQAKEEIRRELAGEKVGWWHDYIDTEATPQPSTEPGLPAVSAQPTDPPEPAPNAAETEQPAAPDVSPSLDAEEIYKNLTVTIREVIFDGNGLITILAIKPPSSDYILLDNHIDIPANYLGSSYSGYQDITIKEYLEQYEPDKIPVRITAGLEIENNISGGGYSRTLEEDGTLVITISTVKIGDPVRTAPSRFACQLTVASIDNWEGGGDYYEWDISFTANAPEPDFFLTSNQQQEMVDYGIRIDRVTLSGTSLSSYVHFYYTIVDKETFDARAGHMLSTISIRDENGAALTLGGAIRTTFIQSLNPFKMGEEHTQFVFHRAMPPLTSQPETLTIKIFDTDEDGPIFIMK